MPMKRSALAPLLLLALAACKPGTPAPEGASPPADSTAAPMSASGEATAGPTSAPRQRGPLEQGRRRTVDLATAAAELPFPLLEPADLPKDSVRTVIHLIEPIEGLENAALPATRFIYDLGLGSSLVMVQAVAHGDLGVGEEREVGGAPGTLLVDGRNLVLTFERDGVHYELRSDQLTEEQLVGMAESLRPVDLAAAAETGPAGDVGAALSGAEGTQAVSATEAVATAPPAP